MKSVSNKKKFKTTLKSLNLFKSEGKKRAAKESSTVSCASTSTTNKAGGLNHTAQAESRVSKNVGTNPLSQPLDSNVTRKYDAQTNFGVGDTTPTSNTATDAKLQQAPQSHEKLEDYSVVDAAEPTLPTNQPPSGTAGRAAWNAARNVVGAVGQSADAFPPLKSVLVGITTILNTYDQIRGNKERSTSLLRRLKALDLPDSDNPDGKELKRRSRLSSALEPIQRELSRIAEQSLLQRAANSVQDSGAVSLCVEDLRDALTDYQVSLQQDLQRMGRESIAKVDVVLLAQLPRAKGARYSSGNRDKCLKGTRIDILEEIWAWAIDFSVARAYWLNGVAGSGKSTIAQTFAEWCFAEGLLGASFFCSRDSEDRSNIHLIFPTLAFQLAERYPEFREALISTISSDSDIGYDSLTVQLERLLLEPLQLTQLTTVIIIDALDECKDKEATSSILSVMGRIVHDIPSVKIFITGRPEPRVRSGFRLPLFLSHTEVFRLHEVEPASVDEDIRTYLKIRLPEAIRDRSDLEISEWWPEEQDVAAVVKKCNGLFIFAATTYRLMMSADEDPRDLLKLVVNVADDTAHEGLMGIDTFYTSIVEQNLSPKRNNPAALAQLQIVLGAVATVFNPLSRSTMANLLGITTTQIKTSLRHLHSVILVPDSDSQMTKVYHKSFPDYLTDPGRCTNASLCVNLDVQHARMSMNCLEVMDKELKRNICNVPRYATNKEIEGLPAVRKRFISGALEYACRFWAHHLQACSGAGEDTQSITRLLETFFENHLLSWLEVLSLAGELQVAVHSLVVVKEWLATVNHADSSLLAWVNDSERYVLYSFDNMQESAAYIYESSVFWLPSSSLVRKYYLNHLATKIQSPNAANPAWDRCTRTIQLVGTKVFCVVFSNDGKLIAATGNSQDDTTSEYLWVFDAATGTTVMTVEKRDGQRFQSTAFSPDCTVIFAGSDKGTLASWDVQTGGLVRVYEGHTYTVRFIAVSTSGVSVASASDDESVRVWDVASGNCTSILKGHTNSVISVCWSPADDKLFSGSEDTTVRLWDPATGICLMVLEIHIPSVKVAAFSPNCAIFASVLRWDKKITLYDSQTGAVLQSIPTGSGVNSVSFSPCSTQILCGTIKSSFIWDIQKQTIVANFDRKHTECAAFSPTGNSMVSGSFGAALRVWQVHSETCEQPTDIGDWPAASRVTHITHSPDGGSIVAGHLDGTIRVWDLATNSCTHTFQGHSDYICTLAFSPDSAQLVSGSEDHTARVWDMSEKKQLWVLDGHEFRVETAQFVSNGTHIISRSVDRIRLWSVETGEMLSAIERPKTGSFFVRTDGVQVISDPGDSGSSNWEIQECVFTDLSSELPAGFIPIQDKHEMYDELPKPQQRYRYLLEDGWILDQHHRTTSWSTRERKWVWSDKESLGDERFPFYNPLLEKRELLDGLDEGWVVNRDGRRILWIPPDRRGVSSNYGKQLAIALEDGRIMTLDFTDV